MKKYRVIAETPTGAKGWIFLNKLGQAKVGKRIKATKFGRETVGALIKQLLRQGWPMAERKRVRD